MAARAVQLPGRIEWPGSRVSACIGEVRDLPSNRGRWGAGDDLGTLNLITDEVRARAVAEARTGRTVSLARQVRATPLLAGGVPAAACYAEAPRGAFRATWRSRMSAMRPSMNVCGICAPVSAR
jgi:hypothetical protein